MLLGVENKSILQHLTGQALLICLALVLEAAYYLGHREPEVEPLDAAFSWRYWILEPEVLVRIDELLPCSNSSPGEQSDEHLVIADVPKT
jgi:hypothetical protein